MIALCASYLQDSGVSTCIVTPNNELKLEFGQELDRVRRRSPESPPVLTLRNYMKKRNEFQFAFVDEAHNLRSAIELDSNAVISIYFEKQDPSFARVVPFSMESRPYVTKELNIESTHDMLDEIRNTRYHNQVSHILKTLSQWRCFCILSHTTCELKFLVANPSERSILSGGRLFLFSATPLDPGELEFYCNISPENVQTYGTAESDFVPKHNVTYLHTFCKTQSVKERFVVATLRDFNLPQKRARPLNGHQLWLDQTYRDMVAYIVRNNPWLNINQITERLIEIKPKWKEMTTKYRKQNQGGFPGGKPTRKTVRKHIRQMLIAGEVLSVGGLFVSPSDYANKEASELNRSIRRILSKSPCEPWNFGYAGSAAGCYIFSQPAYSHQRFQDLLDLEIEQFKDSLFWLDEILRYAISIGKLSPRTYSNNEMDMALLKEGWGKCFGETKLLVFAMALSPPKFLEFLTTNPGRALMTHRLKESWQGIVEKAERDRASFGLAEISSGAHA